MINYTMRSARERAKSKKAKAAYDKDPNRCLHCNSPILSVPSVKLSQTKEKKFCNRSCAARHNNAASRFPKRVKVKSACKDCGTEIDAEDSYRRTFCDECLERSRARVLSMTKVQAGRRTIAGHAATVTKAWEKACAKCGYGTFVDICHIKPVSDFSDDAVLAEINHKDNLVLLCPNHHREFDRGILEI